ncbi:MAG: putative alpha,2-mannosidase, partial [Paenibacillus sp.]|nr:putative alpha,2-mannosidase [Paenibacillus sp.]
MELAATERVGMAHFRFPAAQEGSILFVPPNATKPVYDSRLSIDPDGRTIGGWVRSGGFCNGTNRYTIYFHAEFDAPFRAFGTWDGDIRSDGSRTAGGDDGALYISFDTNVNRTVRMKTAISFVSEENARTNLETEMSGWDIGKVREWTDASWNRILSRIRVSGGTEEQFKTFYTALYRVFLQPSLFNDVNGQYIGFDDIVRKIPDGRNVYSTFSLWDTYRTQPQLLAMLAPDAASDMVNSLLLASHQTTEGG